MASSVENDGAHRPVLIVGSCRSGTTMMRNVLRLHPALAMQAFEQTYVWRYGQYAKEIDELSPEETPPKSIRHIRETFARYQREAGPQRRVGEKTCGNTLRLALAGEALPDCRILHIIRDGRAAAVSASRYWLRDVKISGINPGKVSMLPPGEILRKSFKHIARKIRKALGPARIEPWGPRFKGIYEAVRTMDPIEVCGLQWAQTVETGRRQGQALGADRYYEFRYEEFCRRPVEQMAAILDFLDLPACEAIATWLTENVSCARLDAWRNEVSDEDLEKLLPRVRPLMEELGMPE